MTYQQLTHLAMKVLRGMNKSLVEDMAAILLTHEGDTDNPSLSNEFYDLFEHSASPETDRLTDDEFDELAVVVAKVLEQRLSAALKF